MKTNPYLRISIVGCSDPPGKMYGSETRDEKMAGYWLKKVEELLSQAHLGLIDKVGRIDGDIVLGRKKRKASLSLKEFKEKYAERCRHDIELSEGSIELNNYCFDSFIGVIGESKTLHELTEEDVRKWKRVLTKEAKSRTTISMYHRQLRAAWNRAVKWKFAETNPFDAVEISKGSQPKNKDMSLDEVKKLLSVIEKSGSMRFANFVRFVFLTGCRRSEILFLRWENIDLDNLCLIVHPQKTNKTLTLPINKALKKVIEGIYWTQEKGPLNKIGTK